MDREGDTQSPADGLVTDQPDLIKDGSRLLLGHRFYLVAHVFLAVPFDDCLIRCSVVAVFHGGPPPNSIVETLESREFNWQAASKCIIRQVGSHS